MRCMSCKADDMVDSTATYFAQLNNCYVIIEHVPCKKCEHVEKNFLRHLLWKELIAFWIKWRRLQVRYLLWIIKQQRRN